MQKIRMERLENVEEAVPFNAYYSVRTQQALERVIRTGKSFKDDLLSAMAALKKTAAIREMESGRLNGRLGTQLVRAAEEIIAGRWHEQFVFEPGRCGSGERLTRNMNEVLANRAIELCGEDRGNYEILHPDWHPELPLHPNRFYTAAFQLAVLGYVQAIMQNLQNARFEVTSRAQGVMPLLVALKDRLSVMNGEHFDAKFVKKLAEVTGFPLQPGGSSTEHFETVYDKTASTFKMCMARLEPTLSQVDAVELKAGFIQISAFHDMIAYITRSGFHAQGMEEVAADYAWRCVDLFYEALLQIHRIYG
ncbi:hypothetical protein E5161_08500 [Cohnella pontilimi]|uniref:Fumarate lyase N-terminal domain-containing protein n=1 Tax=Cohnella pontilimi TaxID=2564100 RepID=A0A4U0FD74_9BACL|nr:lyase family protein [Cohnella pontilimi]TJY42866.1 hypothetical protein E5161_08500 [Cohnella pontilimi]